MNEPIKLTPEEIKSVQDLGKKYVEISNKLGQIKIEQLIAKKELERFQELELKTENEYLALNQEESELVSKISEKYGDGSIDVESGTFIPTNSK